MQRSRLTPNSPLHFRESTENDALDLSDQNLKDSIAQINIWSLEFNDCAGDGSAPVLVQSPIGNQKNT